MKCFCEHVTIYFTAPTKFDKDRMNAAVAAVMQNRLKIPAAAAEFGVDRRALWRKVSWILFL